MDEIYNLFIKQKITPNQVYLLNCIRNKVTAAQNFVNISLEKSRLHADGWINEESVLSAKGFALIDEINGYFKTTKKNTSKTLMGQDFDEKIVEYLNIFPKFKLPSGKYARSNKKNLENNFRWFFKTYDFSWEIILKATIRYVDEYERGGYKYMKTSQYYIRKQNLDKESDSELANYCDIIINGTEDQDQSHFSERVV
jgi:hypothetical protein